MNPDVSPLPDPPMQDLPRASTAIAAPSRPPFYCHVCRGNADACINGVDLCRDCAAFVRSAGGDGEKGIAILMRYGRSLVDDWLRSGISADAMDTIIEGLRTRP